ncbi:MAG: hypothetical protein EOO06_16755 [Chitinophagaceae bacterium]|nr:MAG: hypothetical protein EOO06_16755 [Chitinophagaceae bacterium]
MTCLLPFRTMAKNICCLLLFMLPYLAGAQHVGIGTLSPVARLHVEDSSVLFSAAGSTPAQKGNPPVEGSGRRLMWYADKAAFRVGYVANSNWSGDSIGDYSIALGYNPRASGFQSSAIGSSAVSEGREATSIGSATRAIGRNSLALGQLTNAYGEAAIAMGFLSSAYGRNAMAFGFNTNSIGYSALSMGRFTTAAGDNSTAIGFQTSANGNYSTSFGYNTYANGYATTALGIFSDSVVARQTTISTSTPLFIIGNGNDYDDRSNALLVRKDGRVGIGTDYPLTTLHVKQVAGAGGIMLENLGNGNKWRLYSASGDNNLTFYNNANTEIADIDDLTGAYTSLSDQRFKKDVLPLGSVLPNLLKLVPSRYHFNWQQSNESSEIGMIAQHTYALFPELVSYDKENDIYKMNYAGFSTVAIKAIQEQQALIKTLQEEVNAQKATAAQMQAEIMEIKKLLKSGGE